jgi:hypothetical protein
VLVKYWEEQAKKTPKLFNITYTKPTKKNGTPLVTLTVTPHGPKDTPEAEKVVVSCFEAHCLAPAQTTAFWHEMSKLGWGQVCKDGNTEWEFHYQDGTIVPMTVEPKPKRISKNCKRATLDIPDQTAANSAELQTVMEAFADPDLTNTKIIFSFIDSNGTTHEFPVNLQIAPRHKLSNSKRDAETISGTQNEDLLSAPGVASRKFRPSWLLTRTAGVATTLATSSVKASSSKVGNVVSQVKCKAVDEARITCFPAASGTPTASLTKSHSGILTAAPRKSQQVSGNPWSSLRQSLRSTHQTTTSAALKPSPSKSQSKIFSPSFFNTTLKSSHKVTSSVSATPTPESKNPDNSLTQGQKELYLRLKACESIRGEALQDIRCRERVLNEFYQTLFFYKPTSSSAASSSKKHAATPTVTARAVEAEEKQPLANPAVALSLLTPEEEVKLDVLFKSRCSPDLGVQDWQTAQKERERCKQALKSFIIQHRTSSSSVPHSVYELMKILESENETHKHSQSPVIAARDVEAEARKPATTPAPKLTLEERTRLESDYLRKCIPLRVEAGPGLCRQYLVSSIVQHRTASSSTATPTSVASTSVALISKPVPTSAVELKTFVTSATRKHNTSTSTSSTAAPTKSNKPAVPWFCDPAGCAKVKKLDLTLPEQWEKQCAVYPLGYIHREGEVVA